MRKLTVALNWPRTAGEALFYAKHIAARMDGNAYFPSPTPPTSVLLGHIADLEAAEAATRTGAHGTAPERNAKLEIVHGDLLQRRTYVQTVAGQHGEDGEAVIVSSGMSVKRSAGPSRAEFAAKPGRVSGTVILTARRKKRAISHDWQYSTDGRLWVDAERTVGATVTIPALTPGLRYWFRYRRLTTEGLSDWSDPLTMLVG